APCLSLCEGGHGKWRQGYRNRLHCNDGGNRSLSDAERPADVRCEDGERVAVERVDDREGAEREERVPTEPVPLERLAERRRCVPVLQRDPQLTPCGLAQLGPLLRKLLEWRRLLRSSHQPSVRNLNRTDHELSPIRRPPPSSSTIVTSWKCSVCP